MSRRSRFSAVAITVAMVALFGSCTMPDGPPPASTSTTSASSDPKIAAAGDIACDPNAAAFDAGMHDQGNACRALATSRLLASGNLAAVLPLGDTQYDSGSSAQYQASYDPTWGSAKSITRPAIGNEEYGTPNAAGYFGYFGAAAGSPSQGYYSFDVGSWHLIALNAECAKIGGCGAGSPQEQWLRADLAAHASSACTLAYWHQPRFSSGGVGSDATYDAFWRALYDLGADVVLNGHDHDYERFAPQDPDGVADPNRGIREIVVGTGGASLTPRYRSVANSQVFSSSSFGVLRMTLHASSYEMEFLPASGYSFTDTVAGTCH